MDMGFTEDEIARYSRHILLGEVGGTGQAKLRDARVLVVGAGGLGSPALLYLAAAGVGTIGVVDDDVLELSNLQRQIAHATDRLGMRKVHSAAAAARAINPLVAIRTHAIRLDAGNADELVGGYDLVCDGSDNFATRYLVADACVRGRKTLVSAAVLRFEGQISTFKPHDGGGPCYRCLYPEAPPAGMVPSCAEAGVLGAVAGVMGTLQATEALKEIIGIGTGLSGRLLIWDALDARFRSLTIPRDPACAALRAGGRGMTLSILLLSGSYERAHYAFVLATGAAAIGRPVVLFAAGPGCHALLEDWSGLSDAARDATHTERGVAGLDELREAAAAFAVRMIACEAGLRTEGLELGRLMPGVSVAGVVTFLSQAEDGQIVTL